MPTKTTQNFGESARQVFRTLRAGNHRLGASLFLLSELLVVPTRNGNEFALASYRLLFRSREIGMLPYTPGAVQTYVSLHATHRIKAVDALHLATAAYGKRGSVCDRRHQPQKRSRSQV